VEVTVIGYRGIKVYGIKGGFEFLKYYPTFISYISRKLVNNISPGNFALLSTIL
jgi:hypothetical protein